MIWKREVLCLFAERKNYNFQRTSREFDTYGEMKGDLQDAGDIVILWNQILAWCVLHQDELMQNWELSKDGKPMNRINPLVQRGGANVSKSSTGCSNERLFSVCIF